MKNKDPILSNLLCNPTLGHIKNPNYWINFKNEYCINFLNVVFGYGSLAYNKHQWSNI